jgi:hypothetical protein
MGASVLSFVFDAIGSVMTLYGAAYVLAQSRPKLFYEVFAARADPKTKIGAVLVYALLALKVLSVGKFFYHAGSGIFDIIPADWMSYDENGEPEWQTREYLQFVFAVIGVAIAMDAGEAKVAKEGKRIVDEERKEYERWRSTLGGGTDDIAKQ